MITIEEGLRYYLSNYAGLVSLISTRVHPMRIPQGATIPCLTYQRISTPRLNTHDVSGATGTAHPRFQFDAWAATYDSAKDITDQVRAALQGYKGSMGTGGTAVTVQAVLSADERPEFNPETGLYRISSDYIIWHLEAL